MTRCRPPSAAHPTGDDRPPGDGEAGLAEPLQPTPAGVRDLPAAGRGASRARDRRTFRDLRARRRSAALSAVRRSWTTATSPATRSGTATRRKARSSLRRASDRPVGGSFEMRRRWTGSTTRPTTSCSRHTRSSTSRTRCAPCPSGGGSSGATGHLVLVLPHLREHVRPQAPGDDPRAHRGGLRRARPAKTTRRTSRSSSSSAT